MQVFVSSVDRYKFRVPLWNYVDGWSIFMCLHMVHGTPPWLTFGFCNIYAVCSKQAEVQIVTTNYSQQNKLHIVASTVCMKYC